MKKILIALAVVAVTLTSCMTYGFGPVGSGAAIGGTLGSIAGHASSNGNYYSTQIGGLIGTMAGAAVGSAIQKQKAEGAAELRNERQAKAYYQQPALSPSLTLENFSFLDPNGNQIIETGEICRLTFEIVNHANYAMTNVRPVIELTNNVKGISVGSTKSVKSIYAHGKVIYTIPIKASQKLKNGDGSFRVYTKNGDGSFSEPREFTLSTRRR